MTTSVYILYHYKGYFFAEWSKEIIKDGMCGEINDFGINQIYDREFEVNIYHNGKLVDFEINGWTFSYNFKGKSHDSGNYCFTSFEIECFDPDDNELTLYNTPFIKRFNEKEVLLDSLKIACLYSKFENADIAYKFNCLSRLQDERMYGGIRPPINISFEDILKLIKFFSIYYDNVTVGAEEWFLEEIKETVNGAIDYFKNRFDIYRID